MEGGGLGSAKEHAAPLRTATPNLASRFFCIGIGSPMSPNMVPCGTPAAVSVRAVSSSDAWP